MSKAMQRKVTAVVEGQQYRRKYQWPPQPHDQREALRKFNHDNPGVKVSRMFLLGFHNPTARPKGLLKGLRS